MITLRHREVKMISDGKKITEVNVILKISIINFEAFLKKNNGKDAAMIESVLQRIFNYPIYPRGSKIHSDRGLVNIGDGRMGGSHWCAFYFKGNESFYIDSFGGAPDIFPLNQLPKPIIYHVYKKQHLNSKLCGSYCLYFFYLIERMNFKNVFWFFQYAYKCIWKLFKQFWK